MKTVILILKLTFIGVVLANQFFDQDKSNLIWFGKILREIQMVVISIFFNIFQGFVYQQFLVHRVRVKSHFLKW